MDRQQHSFETYALLQAAMEGDEESARRALDAGADVNAVDASGRTALTNAITGESWQTIHASDASFMSENRLGLLSILVSRRDISLYTLNAPQECMSGVCPLGMCAWLNMPTAVETLLDCSAGRMSVDSIDSLGATPLMYATRDGNLEVVHRLLAYGARPDIRDINYRTAIQHALRHSEALWMCEMTLRRARRRIREAIDVKTCSIVTTPSDDSHLQPFPTSDTLPASSSPPFSHHESSNRTDRLIHAILSSDIATIHSLLSPSPSHSDFDHYPVLINRQNSKGWSPIHYCVAAKHPSMEALDALYFAGADVSLFTTTEYYTPLHCLARRAHIAPYSLHPFVVHLIRDLHAPLSARDREDETCIHLAAEHGLTIDVLIALLECDKLKTVRNLRNSRGLTALEVAKPQYRIAFGADAHEPRPPSSMSIRTIRPSVSLATMSPMYMPRSSIESTRPTELSPPVLTDFDVIASSTSFLNNLGYISTELSHHMQPAHLDSLAESLGDAKAASLSILAHFRAQVDDTRKELVAARTTFGRVDNLWISVAQSMEACARDEGVTGDEDLLCELAHTRRLSRDSADSQATAVSAMSREPKMELPNGQDVDAYVAVVQYKNASTSTSISSLNIVIPPPTTTIVAGVRTTFWPEWLESFIPSPETTPTDMEKHDFDFFHRSPKPAPRKDNKRPRTPQTLKGIMRSVKEKEWEEGRTMSKVAVDVTAKNGSPSGSSRLRTWWKKNIVHEHRAHKVEVVVDIDEAGCPVGREVKTSGVDQVSTVLPAAPPASHDAKKLPLDPEMRAHVIALISANRDLGSIEECMTAADQYIATAYRSLARAERIAHRVLATREAAIHNMRARGYAQSRPSSPPDAGLSFLPPNPPAWYSPPAPSGALSSAFSSAQSSRVSLASTLTDNDDEDTRALRGLLLRKINARLDGSFDEIDKATMWLRIIREVVRVVKYRADL